MVGGRIIGWGLGNGKDWIEAGLNGIGEVFEGRLRGGKIRPPEGEILAELGKMLAPLCLSRAKSRRSWRED